MHLSCLLLIDPLLILFYFFDSRYFFFLRVTPIRELVSQRGGRMSTKFDPKRGFVIIFDKIIN
jgi:hypothetical protein